MSKISIVTSFYCQPPNFVDELYENIKRVNVDWEWIVTDDFSPTPEIDERLTQISNKDVRVRKILQKSKREIFRSPWLYTNGDFVFNIDADDRFHPLYLEHCLEWFRKFPDVVCIISGCRWALDSGKIIRYFIDTPFVIPHIKGGIQYPNRNYLGRIWRNTHRPDWSQIFQNPDEIIRYNDRFIVEYLSTKGEILCLPRVYLDYTIRKNSNSSITRTQQEISIINKTSSEFESWLQTQKVKFSRFPYFLSGEVDFQNEMMPFLRIDWVSYPSRVGVIGFSRMEVKRKLLRQLYPEFGFIFDPSPEEDTTIDFYVLCNLDKMSGGLPQKKWYSHFCGNHMKDHIFSYINQNSNCTFAWVSDSDENIWIENYIYT